ncbi:MAG TPA: hypothetical protein VFQ65_03070 [Kofleriaceae bacterium]|nr:hypothetical protein [Kofleriaceae bacterium]
MTWLDVWIRAVIVPAARRALPVWLGAGITAAVIFGGTGMAPHDLTQLALHAPAVGAGLAVTWMLLFVPTARLLVRDDATRYLRSLPFAPLPPRLLAVLALVALQLPWLALWLLGERAVGGALAVALTPIIAVAALWRERPARVASRSWRGPMTGLIAIHGRALRRRASDALLRVCGLAALAGGAAGLFVRNNELAPAEASVLATAVIAVVLVPGWVGCLLPLVESHRASAWLAQSLGIGERARIAALGAVIAGVYVAASALAVGVAAVVIADGQAALWLGAIGVSTSAGLSLVVTRAVIWAERSDAVAAKTVIGAIVASALAVLLLGWLGAEGAAALFGVGVLAIGSSS